MAKCRAVCLNGAFGKLDRLSVGGYGENCNLDEMSGLILETIQDMRLYQNR